MSKSSLSIDGLQALIDRSAFHQLFKPVVLGINQDKLEIVIKMTFSESLERQPGSNQWHGGGISAIIDIAGCYALALIPGVPLPTIDLRTDYLRPAINTDLTASACVRKAGKSIGIVDVDVHDDAQKLVAVGRGSYSMKAFANN